MPVNQLTNALSEENEPADYGHHSIMMQYDPAASGNLVNGTVVSLEPYATNFPFVINKALHTAVDFYMLGVVVNAPTGGYTPGSAVEVLTEGICQVLFDANDTTAGHLGLQGATTDGTLTDSATATLAKTMATILQAVTIESGTALVWCYVHKM